MPFTDALAQPRENLWLLLTVYSVLIAGSSLVGGWLPGRVRLSHLRFQLTLSLIGGLILGIGVFHLMPHALHELGPDRAGTAANWLMVGMLLMFFLLRTLHVHHHEPGTAEKPADAGPHDHHSDRCQHHHPPRTGLSWAGILLGLAIHTLLDGFALGATMQADAHSGQAFAGIGILLAIALHKPLDSLSITTLMMEAGKSARWRLLVNIVYAGLCPLGAAAFLLGVGQLEEGSRYVVGCSLAFSAGVFICIALADLLPEMEFHAHHRVQLSVALLLGISLAWAIRFLEPAHLHH